jgi:hypothetical protein
VRQLKLMFSLDVNLYDGLPEDLTLPKLAAYLDMEVNDYCDGRDPLCVEAFAALFDVRPAMVRAICDVVGKAREKQGLPKMVESGPLSQTNASYLIAAERIKEAMIRHGVLEFQSVELMPEGEES